VLDRVIGHGVRSAQVLETVWPSILLERGNEAVGGLHGWQIPPRRHNYDDQKRLCRCVTSRDPYYSSRVRSI
jgi:hypothetical protein